MAKTISESKFRRAAYLVDNAIQPAIKKIVDKANESLKAEGIRIGVDLNWMFDEVTDNKEKDDDED